MAVAVQVRLANDVAAHVRHLPHDAAVEAFLTHLRSFWEPRMRAELAAAVAAGGEAVAGLDPVAADAVRRLGETAHAP